MGISRGIGDVTMTPSGVIVPFAGSNAPSGWLLCAGQAVSRTQYAGLFLTISTTYGVGDGSTTFNLPDLRGRTIAGLDNMGGSAASRLTAGVSGINATTLGAVGGDERVHQHSHSNTASFSGSFSGNTGTTGGMNANNPHTHSQVYNGSPSGGGLDGSKFAYGTVSDLSWRSVSISSTDIAHGHSFTPSGSISGSVTMSNANAGSGTAQNVPPTIVLNYIIRI